MTCGKPCGMNHLSTGSLSPAFTGTLSQNPTGTLSHKPIVRIPIDSPIVAGAVLWKTQSVSAQPALADNGLIFTFEGKANGE